MKVIFLDICGTLDNRETIKKSKEIVSSLPYECNPCYALDRDCITRVNLLLNMVNAEIVISSSIRRVKPLPWITEHLKVFGLIKDPIDMTPVLSGKLRGEEIQTWLNSHTVESFVILDDGCDMLHLETKQVLVDGEIGLVDSDISKALEILKP